MTDELAGTGGTAPTGRPSCAFLDGRSTSASALAVDRHGLTKDTGLVRNVDDRAGGHLTGILFDS